MHYLEYGAYVTHPRMNYDGLPHNEREHGFLINCNLANFDAQVRSFESALTLFDYCENEIALRDVGFEPSLYTSPNEGQKFRSWQHIAARDAAMSVFHASVAFQGAKANAHKCKEIRSIFDWVALKTAEKLFNKEFPVHALVRNAIAHATLKTRDASRHNEHVVIRRDDITFESAKEGLTVTNILQGRTLTNSWQGKLIEHTLDEAKLTALRNVRSIIWKEFRKADRFTNERARARATPVQTLS